MTKRWWLQSRLICNDNGYANPIPAVSTTSKHVLFQTICRLVRLDSSQTTWPSPDWSTTLSKNVPVIQRLITEHCNDWMNTMVISTETNVKFLNVSTEICFRSPQVIQLRFAYLHNKSAKTFPKTMLKTITQIKIQSTEKIKKNFFYCQFPHQGKVSD